jgi:hypothetical protein
MMRQSLLAMLVEFVSNFNAREKGLHFLPPKVTLSTEPACLLNCRRGSSR